MNEKEMLEWWDRQVFVSSSVIKPQDAKKDVAIMMAIRTAIVRLGECAKRAVEIMDDAEKLDHETWEEVVMEFLEDIRDFGEEGK